MADLSTVTCSFEFVSDRRPRQHCGSPAIVADPPRCRWHALAAAPEDPRQALQAEAAKPEHWLEGAILSRMQLRDVVLFRTRMPRADLEYCICNGASFAEANLTEANLSSTDARGAQFPQANLSRARFDNSDLKGADLRYADLSGACLRGCTLDGAYLLGARFDSETVVDSVNWGEPGEFAEGRWLDAARVFRAIGTHLRTIAAHHESTQLYFREMTALHLHTLSSARYPGRVWQWLKWWPPRSFVVSVVWLSHRWFWGYGSRPLRILPWLLGVICLFGLGIFPHIGSGMSYSEGLALSLVTFATLGYGNRVPQTVLGEALGGAEALLGSLMMSAFLVALATKYVHRG